MPRSYRYPVAVISGWPVITDMGALRHPIRIQQYGQSGYDEAGPQNAWSDVVSAQASIDFLGGSDVVQNGQITSRAQILVTMWYQPGIQPNMRVIAPNGSIYTIQWLDDVLHMNVVLILNCIAIGLNE